MKLGAGAELGFWFQGRFIEVQYGVDRVLFVIGIFCELVQVETFEKKQSSI